MHKPPISKSSTVLEYSFRAPRGRVVNTVIEMFTVAGSIPGTLPLYNPRSEIQNTLIVCDAMCKYNP